jgi:hypothetical protein
MCEEDFWHEHPLDDKEIIALLGGPHSETNND